MPSGASLLAFSFRAVLLLLLVPLLWLPLAERYNDILAAAAMGLLPDWLSLNTVGSHILISYSPQAGPVSVEGLALHYGLVLMTVLVLAAVGVGVRARIGWLVGLWSGLFVLHIVALVLLARGVAWAHGDHTAVWADSLVFGLYAIFWGLAPALIAGAWAFGYWLPRWMRADMEDKNKRADLRDQRAAIGS